VRAYVYIYTHIFPYIPFVLQPVRLCHGPFRFIVNSIYPAVAYRSLVEYRCALKRAPTPRRESIRRGGAAFGVSQKRNAPGNANERMTSRSVVSRGINSRNSPREFFDYKFSNKFRAGVARRAASRASRMPGSREISPRGMRLRNTFRIMFVALRTETELARHARISGRKKLRHGMARVFGRRPGCFSSS